MFPTLIDLGTHDLPLLGETHIALPTYGFLFATGVLVAWGWFVRRGRSIGVADEQLFNLSFYSLLGGILGAKLTLVAIDWRLYSRNPGELIYILRSAGVLAGGVVVGTLVFMGYCRRHRLPLWRLGDAIAAPLAFAQSLGRLGCFSAGCCWGKVAGHGNRLAVTFTDPRANAQTGVPLNVPLIPTQLIQMANDLLLAVLLTLLWRKRLRPDGLVFWIYVVLYSVSRSLIEFWRGDHQRGLYLGDRLSTTQIFSLAALAVAIWMIWRSVRRRAG